MSSLIDTFDGREQLQTALYKHGFYTGPIDGDLGQLSRKAIIAARVAYNLPQQTEPVFDVALERSLGLLTIESPAVVAVSKLGGIDILALLKLIPLIQSIQKGTLMDGSKPWYTSQTIWASILGGLAAVLAIFHVNFGVADQATAVEIILQAISVGSAVWAAISRVTATKTIG